MGIADNLKKYKNELDARGVQLVAVSKNHPAAAVEEAYQAGQRIFGENLVQEMVEKAATLPTDIEWHLIGHLQSNKVKYIAPFVALIESVDSLKLLKEINKQALKHDRIIDCLLQVNIADEDTKFGLDFDEVIDLLRDESFVSLKNVRIRGLMGIATNAASDLQIRAEFNELKVLFDGIRISYFRKEASFDRLSMGMSSDYQLAIEQGSNMVRIGSHIFGKRIIKHWKNN